MDLLQDSSTPNLPFAIKVPGRADVGLKAAMADAFRQGYGIVLITDRWAGVQLTSSTLTEKGQRHYSLHVERDSDLLDHRAWLDAAWRSDRKRGAVSLVVDRAPCGASMGCSALRAAVDVLSADIDSDRDSLTLVVCDFMPPPHHVGEYKALIGELLVRTDSSLLAVDRHHQLQGVHLPQFSQEHLVRPPMDGPRLLPALAAKALKMLGVGKVNGPPASFWRGKTSMASSAQRPGLVLGSNAIRP